MKLEVTTLRRGIFVINIHKHELSEKMFYINQHSFNMAGKSHYITGELRLYNSYKRIDDLIV